MSLLLVIGAVWIVALTPVFALGAIVALADRDAQRMAGTNHVDQERVS
jgi:hypothetical protein